jgi:hypothetical protein
MKSDHANADQAAASQEHGQPFDIIINAEQVEVTQKALTFRELCKLAFPAGELNDNISYTVTYADPHGPEGSLVDGESVKIKKGMIFNVGRSDKS